MDVQLTPAIRYWELEAHRTAILLQELKASGVKSIGIWLPWAHFENNGKAAFRTFLRQAIHFNLRVRINICPEVSVGYFYGGIPIDLLQKAENLARDRTGQIIYACAPPNIYPLVNLNAPAVFQRFGHLLLQVSQEISDLLEENIDGRIELIIGDSFFKHYHTSGLPEEDHGEYSAQFFQRELSFMQNWSSEQAERTFIRRAYQFLQTRFEYSQEVKLSVKKYFMRSSSLDRLVDEISGSVLDPKQFFSQMKGARSHCDAVWIESCDGVDPKERSFLMSAALTMYGDLWLPAEEYLRTSKTFQKKMVTISSSFFGKESFYDRTVIMAVQNRFVPSHLAKILEQKIGSSIEFLNMPIELEKVDLKMRGLLIFEDSLKVSVELLRKLIQETRESKISVAVFRSSLCKKGLAELQCLEKFRYSSGWTYDVSVFPSGGHLILIEGQEFHEKSIEQLAERLLSVSEIDSWCKYNKKIISNISVRAGTSGNKAEERILFFYNPTENAQDLEVSFHRDFALEGIEFQNKRNNSRSEAGLGDELSAQLPPWSVVPLSVSSVDSFVAVETKAVAESKVVAEPELEPRLNSLPAIEIDLNIQRNEGVQDGASEPLVQI